MYKDFLETLLKSNLFLVFGFQDIRVKYRRSSIGVFWLTINMSIYILVLSFVFGLLFNNEIKDFIPYLSLGLILWGFISTNINESCNHLNKEKLILCYLTQNMYHGCYLNSSDQFSIKNRSKMPLLVIFR